MFTFKTRQAVHQATALGLSAVLTVVVMSSLNLLATQPVAEAEMAAASSPTQVVVVHGQRLPRS